MLRMAVCRVGCCCELPQIVVWPTTAFVWLLDVVGCLEQASDMLFDKMPGLRVSDTAPGKVSNWATRKDLETNLFVEQHICCKPLPMRELGDVGGLLM